MSRANAFHASRSETPRPMSPSSVTAMERSLSHGDVLHVAVEVEAPVPAFAAQPGVARAAERRGELADEEAVHPQGTRDDALRDRHRAALVAAEQDAGEAVAGVVRRRDGLVVAREGPPGEDRTEHLALRDLGVGPDLVEQSRLEVELSRCVAAAAEERAAACCLRALHEAGYAREVLAGDQRPDPRLRVARVADRHARRGCAHLVEERIGD